MRTVPHDDHATPFNDRTQHVHINATTVRNLELFSNETNGEQTGSLYWVINQTASANYRAAFYNAKMWRKFIFTSTGSSTRRPAPTTAPLAAPFYNANNVA